SSAAIDCLRLPSPRAYPLSFFFYSFRAHQALHSFPTRRSSDLIYLHAIDMEALILFSDNFFCMVHNVSFNSLMKAVHNSVVLVQDRKSTRLNSSHVSISYAVFCLKKKK